MNVCVFNEGAVCVGVWGRCEDTVCVCVPEPGGPTHGPMAVILRVPGCLLGCDPAACLLGAHRGSVSATTYKIAFTRRERLTERLHLLLFT